MPRAGLTSARLSGRLMNRGVQQFVLGGLRCVELCDDAAGAGHENTIGHAQHLRQIGRDDDNRLAFIGEILAVRCSVLIFSRWTQ